MENFTEHNRDKQKVVKDMDMINFERFAKMFLVVMILTWGTFWK
jgi:hypothetical protein